MFLPGPDSIGSGTKNELIAGKVTNGKRYLKRIVEVSGLSAVRLLLLPEQFAQALHFHRQLIGTAPFLQRLLLSGQHPHPGLGVDEAQHPALGQEAESQFLTRQAAVRRKWDGDILALRQAEALQRRIQETRLGIEQEILADPESPVVDALLVEIDFPGLLGRISKTTQGTVFSSQVRNERR